MSILGFAVYLESSLKFQGIFNHDGLHYLALSPLTNQFSYLVIWAHHLCPLVYCHSFSYALLWQWYFRVLLLTSFRIKSCWAYSTRVSHVSCFEFTHIIVLTAILQILSPSIGWWSFCRSYGLPFSCWPLRLPQVWARSLLYCGGSHAGGCSSSPSWLLCPSIQYVLCLS